jgi:alpha-1,2-glucosyltransferase
VAFLYGSHNPKHAATSTSVVKIKLPVTTIAYVANALLVIGITIKYNTLIHPFTLADNRHYVFYVFRYTILRHPIIRYLLGPVYILCFHLAFRALSNPSSPGPQHPKAPTTRPAAQIQGPKTSFLLVFLISTALSLITAPLVEPRYFILPWVMWRLNVPPPSTSRPSQKKIRRSTRQESVAVKIVGTVRAWLEEGSAVFLGGETFWFLLINAVTGYVFLYHGFEWPQEPGKVQRFMW